MENMNPSNYHSLNHFWSCQVIYLTSINISLKVNFTLNVVYFFIYLVKSRQVKKYTSKVLFKIKIRQHYLVPLLQIILMS